MKETRGDFRFRERVLKVYGDIIKEHKKDEHLAKSRANAFYHAAGLGHEIRKRWNDGLGEIEKWNLYNDFKKTHGLDKVPSCIREARDLLQDRYLRAPRMVTINEYKKINDLRGGEYRSSFLGEQRPRKAKQYPTNRSLF